MSITKWEVDVAHSSIDFSVRHLMIAKVKGAFEKFTADITADPADMATASIAITIDAASINTRINDRDNHLRSADFFDVAKHPTIQFVANKIVKTGDNTYDVSGDLTMIGVTKPETFKLVYEGTIKDFAGVEKAGFSGSGKIVRTNYGLNWNKALETGGVLVGEDVSIEFEMQLANKG